MVPVLFRLPIMKLVCVPADLRKRPALFMTSVGVALVSTASV